MNIRTHRGTSNPVDEEGWKLWKKIDEESETKNKRVIYDNTSRNKLFILKPTKERHIIHSNR